jgi:hypothetical protein
MAEATVRLSRAWSATGIGAQEQKPTWKRFGALRHHRTSR